MRTNVEIDDQLMAKALRLTGLRTKRAVANYHALRRRGITPGTVDMIIATYSITTGASLLTADRDFIPMRDHLGLRLVDS